MAHVWTCTDYDTGTHTCVSEGWVMQDTWTQMLPDVGQANEVGGAMFVAISLVMAMTLLLPPRDGDDD